MAKNALQSTLDTLRGGAKAILGTTPVGQLASKISRTQQVLRVPSVGELENAYNQSVGRVSSFVQKNPTPISFVQKSIPIHQVKIPTIQYNPKQTFTENMRLLSQPIKSLTTETPAARFLFEKIGGPADYAGITGKPTVGKYIAGTIEGSLPGLIPLSGTPKIARNIVREGINIPAAIKSGAGLTAFNIALNKLKGEKITPQELVGSFGFGALFGGLEPSPMKGIATTELGNARKLLSKYGFELQDYENSLTLKSKFRSLANKYAPRTAEESMAGHPKNEEWKAIVDAWNKTTSAGIKPEWGLPDVLGWIRNLWNKKPQQKTTSLLPVKATEANTNQLFGKVIDVVKRESGVGAHIFEGPEIRTVLKKAGLQSIPEGMIDAPGYVAQYIKRDPATGKTIVPRLVINILPEEKPTIPVPKPIVIQKVKQQEALRDIRPSKELAEMATKVPKEMIKELGYPVEKPHALSVAVLNQLGEKTVNSGFQTNFKPQVWSITIQGKPSEELMRAAKSSGLELRERLSVPTNKDSLMTDIYLPNVGVDEKGIVTATDTFDAFAKKYAELKTIANVQPTVKTEEVLQPKPVEKPSTVTTGTQKPLPEAPVEVIKQLEDDLGKKDLGFDEFNKKYESLSKQYSLPPVEKFLAKKNAEMEKLLATPVGPKPVETQAIPTTKEEPSALIPEVPKQPTVPEIPPPVSKKEKIRGFVKSVLESDVADEEWKKKIIEDIRLYYKVKGMDQTTREAEKMISEDPQGTLAKVIDLNQRSDALNAAGMMLMVDAGANKNYDLANQIHDVLAEKALLGGRETNIWRLLDKMSPTGRVQYARKVVKDILTKLTSWDKKINKIHYLSESPQIAQSISKEMNAVNKEVVDAVSKEVEDKFQKTAKRRTEEKSADELLGERIIRYVKSLTGKPEKKNDPISIMVNTLYRVAMEVLPKKQSIPPDPLKFITEAIKNKKEYREAWDMAQDIVKEKFVDNPTALEALDEYFASYLNKPFATTQLNQLVSKRIKENQINIAQVVRDYYVEAQHQVGETLAKRLSEEAGLTDEDARMLEQYVTKRFDELTSNKKEQILTNLTKDKPKIAQRSFIRRVLDLSNLGAFNQKKYYDLIAKKLNIPNVSEELAEDIYQKTQTLQSLPEGSKEREKLARDVMDLISDQVPPGIFDIFDSYRYQNLLSNPRTFLLRNPFWNFLEATTFVPAELALESSIDYLRSTLTGKERQIYGSVPAYYKGLINAMPNAFEVGRQVWRGEMPIENPDLKHLKMRSLEKRYPRLTVVPRIMEIGDQTFRTLISQAYSSALQANGMEKEAADQIGAATALDALLRRKLNVKGDEGRGSIITGLDVLGNAILQAKKAPFWGGLLSYLIPFVSTPLQYAEMTLEYTPLFPAINELVSKATNQEYTYEQKRRHMARAFIGLIIMGIASAVATGGNTSWTLPEDEKERSAWYDAKKKPYAIKIGNVWIPFQLFGPLFLALAIPAAVRYYNVDSKTAMTDTTTKKITNILWGLARAYTDLTFLSSIGDFFSALEGNYDSTIDRWMANTISQVSPLVGFTRYLSILVDPTYRKSKGFWEALQKNYPFATKKLEPYTTLKGEESKRDFSSYVLPYDIGIENPEARFLWNQRHLHLQEGAVINQIISKLELPKGIQKGTEQELDYINDHPEVSYGTIFRSLKSRFDSLGQEEFKIYADKQMSAEEKNANYEDIQVQKKDILDQIDTLWKEVLQSKGEKVDQRNIFDVVEAAEYANDFKDIIKRVEQTKEPKTAAQYLDEIKILNSDVEKYKRVRKFFDQEALQGKYTFDRSKAYAQRTGLNADVAEYDYWTAQEVRERKLYTLSRITDLSGNDMWNALLSLRRESPGTGDKVLTDDIINDLVDEGYINKSTGTKLKKVKMKMNDNGEILSKLQSLGGRSTKLSDLKKVSALITKRNKAITQAMKIKRSTIKIPKIKLPKAPTVKTIKVKPLVTSQQKFVLKMPKLKKIKIPGTIRNLIYAKRSF